jgi:hypothetical protein
LAVYESVVAKTLRSVEIPTDVDIVLQGTPSGGVKQKVVSLDDDDSSRGVHSDAGCYRFVEISVVVRGVDGFVRSCCADAFQEVEKAMDVESVGGSLLVGEAQSFELGHGEVEAVHRDDLAG